MQTIEITDGDDKGMTVTFDDCIIATGAVVRTLPGIELSENVVSYEEQILNPEAPEKMVIVGAGAIGMEFAYVLSNYGVDVTVIEYQDRVLPNEDKDVSKEIAKAYKKLGVKLLTGHATTEVRDNGDSVEVDVKKNGSDDVQTLTADRVMISVGFAPRTEGYGLENTGVELTDRGAINVDERMRTNVDGIYAIGDVTAKLQLAHVAEAQGIIAAETIADAETLEIEDYMMTPRATFCNPQVASMGYTEEQAKEKWPDRDIKVATFPFSANGKAVGLNETAGFGKLVADAEFGEILGAHLVGALLREPTIERVIAIDSSKPSAQFRRRMGDAEFVRLASGHFERGMKLLHVRSRKPMAVSNPVLFLAADREIGRALLDQHKLAGIGNEYRAEINFLAGTHPAELVRDVDVEKHVRLARRLMWANKDAPVRVTTGIKRAGETSYVFGRNNKPCRRCGTLIAKGFLGGEGDLERVIWWCPQCQPEPDAPAPHGG